MKKKDNQTVRGCTRVYVKDTEQSTERTQKRASERYSETMINVQGSHLEAGALVMGAAGAE